MEKEVRNWINEIKKVKEGEVDLSRDEDLSIALMNLISLEEHFYFTAVKTNNKRYLEMLNTVRELRKSLLKKIVVNPVGEEWCISKHLLAASMRLIEVGTKELTKGNEKEADMFFKQAFNLHSLFFAINLKMIGVDKVEKSVIEEQDQGGMMQKFSTIMKKIIDCCKE